MSNEWATALHQVELCQGYRLSGDKPTRTRTSITDQHKKVVLEYLEQSPPSAPNDIARVLHLSKYQIHRVLRLLVDEQLVVTVRKKMHKIGDPFVFYTLP
jgi:predicted ArsR family transcriptional regulator